MKHITATPENVWYPAHVVSEQASEIAAARRWAHTWKRAAKRYRYLLDLSEQSAGIYRERAEAAVTELAECRRELDKALAREAHLMELVREVQE